MLRDWLILCSVGQRQIWLWFYWPFLAFWLYVQSQGVFLWLALVSESGYVPLALGSGLKCNFSWLRFQTQRAFLSPALGSGRGWVSLASSFTLYLSPKAYDFPHHGWAFEEVSSTKYDFCDRVMGLSKQLVAYVCSCHYWTHVAFSIGVLLHQSTHSWARLFLSFPLSRLHRTLQIVKSKEVPIFSAIQPRCVASSETGKNGKNMYCLVGFCRHPDQQLTIIPYLL